MTYDPKIVSLFWRGFGTLAILREFNPGTAGEEREIENAISETRTAVEKLRGDLPGIIRSALLKGFTHKQIFDTIFEKGEGLIPTWDLECLIAGVQKKLDDEGRPAREAAEKAEADARKAAIEKRISDAKQALRDMGAQL